MARKKLGREAKFLNTLKKRNITRMTAARKFDLVNPSAAINRFKDAGHNITKKYNRHANGRIKSVVYQYAG